jgi:hypothetical protein
MRFRKLRIAWSVGWIIACVLLIVLWVRSYYVNDVVWNVNKSFVVITIGSTSGTAYLFRENRGVASITVALSGGGTATDKVSQTFGWKHTSSKPAKIDSMFKWESTATAIMIHIPYWLLEVPFVAAGLIPWLPRRFTLRTLLIATTVVAVVLGLIVYAVR